MTESDDDIRDGALFCLWIRLAAETPGRVAVALASCLSVKDYRAALMQLAAEEKINLP